MSRKVISVEHVWKQYRLGIVGTGTLSNDFKKWWFRMAGKEDPFLKVGEVNDRTKKGESDLVWALQDVSFDVNEGEVLGIIGKNGAGKSTILKILSRVTAPTIGEIKIKGRIASLLEVGTGFHPDLTGRENIFLNGAIFGMNKAEIRSKFDEIVDFSGVERYIDTPVKRYSSGMYVRLAFAVAAHLDPEILILDEVLSVGDVEFQKKCLGKMKDVSGQGRTVIFVSHNMTAIKNLCTRGILFDKGKIVFSGNISDVVHDYLKFADVPEMSSGEISWDESTGPGGEEVKLKSIRLMNDKKEISTTFYTTGSISVIVDYHVKKEISGARMILQLRDGNNNIIFSSTNHSVDSEKKSPGIYRTTCIIPANLLNRGRHHVQIHMGIPGIKVLVQGKPFISFDTILMGNNGSMFPDNWVGAVAPLLEWETQKQI